MICVHYAAMRTPTRRDELHVRRRQRLSTPAWLFIEQPRQTSSPAVHVKQAERLLYCMFCFIIIITGCRVRRKNTTHSVLRLTRSLRGIGRSVGRRNHKAFANKILKDKRIRGHVLTILTRKSLPTCAQ